jgi:hypothetical protein
VAKAYSQTEGIDFHEIFSLVVKLVSIRVVLVLVALLDHDSKRRFVCKIKNSFYGIKQSSRKWYNKFNSFMVSQNFTRSEYDHCVYLKSLENGIFIILVLYVKDMLVARKKMVEINKLKAQLDRTFDLKDLGAKKQILGIEIHRDEKHGKF